MEFVLRIQIGNDATLGDANLADIVAGIAKDIAWKGIEDNRRFAVRDANGNTVGHYGRYDVLETNNEVETSGHGRRTQ